MRWTLILLILLTLSTSVVGQPSVSNPTITTPHLQVNDWIKVKNVYVYGKKASGNLLEAINTHDGSTDDSTFIVYPDGYVLAERFIVNQNNGIYTWGPNYNMRIISNDGVGTSVDYITFYVQGTYPLRLKDNEIGCFTSSPADYCFTFGDKDSRIDLLISGEATPGDKADSLVHAWVYSGDGRVTTLAGDGDSLYVTSSTSYGVIGSNNPLQEIVGGNATRYLNIVTLADEGEFSMPTGICGFGDVMIGDNQEWAKIRFTSAGVVILQDASSNVTSTNDTDNNMNIYDGGSGIVIENQLGAPLKVCIDLTYYTP